MNLYIPNADPKKDVSQLPKEMMGTMPNFTPYTPPAGPGGGIPGVNMSPANPIPPAPQQTPPMTPIVDPMGKNIAGGIPQPITPVQSTAIQNSTPTPGPTALGAITPPSPNEPTEEDYQKASDYFDTIKLTPDEVDFIDNSVKQGHEFKDAMLYIASRRQNQDTTTWEDTPAAPAESKGNWLAELLRINEDTGKMTAQPGDSEVTQLAKRYGNDLGSVAKFIANIPADTVELAGGLLDMAMNPWTSAKGLMSLLGTAGQGATEAGIAALTGSDTTQVKKDLGEKAKAVSQDPNAGGVSKFLANNFIKNEAIMQAIAQEIVNNFGSEENMRKTIVENPADVITTILPIGEALKGIKIANIAGEGSKAAQYAQFIKGLQEAKSSVSFMKPAILEGKMAQKLGKLKISTEVDPRISVVNKVGDLFGNKELAAKSFAGLDNAEIGAIKSVGPTYVQNTIKELNTLDEAALEGGGRGNIYNPLHQEVMQGIGKRSEELKALEKTRKEIVKDAAVDFTKNEIKSIFDRQLERQGITRTPEGFKVVGEGAIKESELGKLDDLEREVLRTDKDTYTAQEIDARIKNLQKNLYDKQGMPKNGSEAVTKMTEGIIADLNETFKEKMPPEYADAKTKMSEILTDRKRILKELKEEDNSIAMGRDIENMDDSEVLKLIEDNIAGNRMALFLRRLASNTTTGGDPQSLANTVKRFTGVDVENKAIALRALAKATGKTQIANELGGLLTSNRSMMDKAIAAGGKLLSPSGEKTIKELAARGEEKVIPYEAKTVKYTKPEPVVETVTKPTGNKFVKAVEEKKIEPSTVDYGRAKGMVERPGAKTEVRGPSNLTAARADRRGVIVTPQGEIKALPPAQPVWAQQMDGQYSDPHGYMKAVERDLMNERLKLDQVSNYGNTTTTDELNFALNDRNIQTKESFYDLLLEKNNIKNDVGFTQLLDDVYRGHVDGLAEYYMGPADYKEMTNPVQINAVRGVFGEDLAKDLIEGYRYMEKNGYEDIVSAIGKSGNKNKAISKFIDAVAEYNHRTNKEGSATYNLNPDEAYNLIKDMVSDIQQKQKKFQTLADRYEVAPELSVKQVKEIMGKDFPVKIVDRLKTEEGRKAMGMYFQGVVEIAKNPVATTGYHEAFHAWLDIYGPSKLRDAAFKQIERTTGLTSRLDIEEHLAESFAMWKLSGRTVSGALKQFFQAIWEDIKGMIGKQDKVTDLFRNVGKKGRMNEMSKNRMLQDLAYESPNGITTKVLDELQGRTSVSKEFIQNLLKRDDVRQVEKDIFAEKLRNFGDKVDVGELGDQIRAELLPLKSMTPLKSKYDFVSLPEEQRGKVKDYKEKVYESPVKTEAGNIHFRGNFERVSDNTGNTGVKRVGTPQNYFGHTRVEDMADNKTRRVIEVQSDLYQKGNLERELPIEGYPVKHALTELQKETRKDPNKRIAEVQKLKQYTDPTAHFRMVREEIATAAKDGKTKLQFPTGETAMKVEGLGQQDQIRFLNPERVGQGNATLKADEMKVGMPIQEVIGNSDKDWIITEVLGDGKFKATPKSVFDELEADTPKLIRDTIADAQDPKIKDNPFKEMIDQNQESFDISGKVDTQNPIYKFYENEMQKYLKRFGAQRVTDDKGVSWFEVPIKEEYGKRPVQAFQSVANDNTIYRGGKDGEFFTTKKTIAGQYGDVKEFSVKNGAKIKTGSSKLSVLREYEPSFTPEKRERVYDRMIKEGLVGGKTAEQRLEMLIDEKIKGHLSKDGYDGFKIENKSSHSDTDGELRIWNKKAVGEKQNGGSQTLQNEKNNVSQISVDDIDAGYDPSDEKEIQVINQMASDLRKGAKFPPIIMDNNGNIIDGYHRLEAYRMVGKKTIPVIFKKVKSK